MFLLPSIVLGIGLALLLGGRPSRLLELRFRGASAVLLALGLQAALATSWTDRLPTAIESSAHVASYALLLVFAVANIRNLALFPLFLGMALNAIAIAANGGKMPVSPGAWEAAALDAGAHSNVSRGAERLGFLGDVFALPQSFPLANVFSVGDLLIAAGAVLFIVSGSLGGVSRLLAPKRLIRPFQSPSFRRLAIGKLVSHLGDWLTLAVLIGWVYGETGSTTNVVVILFVRLAPPILGGGLAAALVDRLPKAQLLVWMELVRGLAVAGALAGVLLESRPIVFAAVAVSGALAAVSATTVSALVPSLASEEELPAANATLGIAQDAAMAIGALGAGLALSFSDVPIALLVDLGTFLVAALLYSGIRALRGEPGGGEAHASHDSEEGLLAGLRHLFHRRSLAVVVGAFGVATLATGLTNASLPRFLAELGLGDAAYGFGLSALAWGLAAGQAVVGFSRVGSGAGRWIGAGLLLMSGLFVALAFTTHAPTAILVLALIGLLDGTTDVLFDTVVQREADPRFYGRIFGLASAFMSTTMMGALAVAPLLNRLAPPQEVILAAGTALLVASTIALLGSPHRAEPARADEGEGRGEESAALAPVLTLVPRAEPETPESPSQPVPVPAQSFRVFVRLSDGDRVSVGEFARADEAHTRAREAIAYMSELPLGEWPLFGTRFLRPSAIISVDVVEQQRAMSAELLEGTDPAASGSAAESRAG